MNRDVHLEIIFVRQSSEKECVATVFFRVNKGKGKLARVGRGAYVGAALDLFALKRLFDCVGSQVGVTTGFP